MDDAADWLSSHIPIVIGLVGGLVVLVVLYYLYKNSASGSDSSGSTSSLSPQEQAAYTESMQGMSDSLADTDTQAELKSQAAQLAYKSALAADSAAVKTSFYADESSTDQNLYGTSIAGIEALSADAASIYEQGNANNEAALQVYANSAGTMSAAAMKALSSEGSATLNSYASITDAALKTQAAAVQSFGNAVGSEATATAQDTGEALSSAGSALSSADAANAQEFTVSTLYPLGANGAFGSIV